MIFIGCKQGSKGYWFYDPNSEKLIVSRDASLRREKNEAGAYKIMQVKRTSDSFIVHSIANHHADLGTCDLDDENEPTAPLEATPLQRR